MAVRVRERTKDPTAVSPLLHHSLPPSLTVSLCVCVCVQSPSKEQVWHMKGALEVVLRHCTSRLDGGVLTAAEKAHYSAIASQFGHRGLRGMSYAVLPVLFRFWSKTMDYSPWFHFWKLKKRHYWVL